MPKEKLIIHENCTLREKGEDGLENAFEATLCLFSSKQNWNHLNDKESKRAEPSPLQHNRVRQR